MGELLIKIVLDALIWLIVIPAVTNQGVRINGGFLTAVLCSFLVCVLHYILWIMIALLTVGMALIVQVLTFGLVGVFITMFAINLASDMAPNSLQVRSGSFIAALVLVILNALIDHVLRSPSAIPL